MTILSRCLPLIAVGASFLAIQQGCTRKPEIVEYPQFIDVPNNSELGELAQVPFVVIGTIKADERVGSLQKSSWGKKTPVQMFRIRVEIENVLAGDIGKGSEDVFYFRSAGAWSGPARLGLLGQGGTWKLGDREIFFLQRNNGLLRTICDDYAHCVTPLFSGPHPRFVRNPNRWIGFDLADILLTPGSGCGEAQLATALSRSTGTARALSGDYALKIVEKTANDSSGQLRIAACQALKEQGRPTCPQS